MYRMIVVKHKIDIRLKLRGFQGGQNRFWLHFVNANCQLFFPVGTCYLLD